MRQGESVSPSVSQSVSQSVGEGGREGVAEKVCQSVRRIWSLSSSLFHSLTYDDRVFMFPSYGFPLFLHLHPYSTPRTPSNTQLHLLSLLKRLHPLLLYLLYSHLSSLFFIRSLLSSLFSLSHIFFFLLFTPLLLFLPHSPSIIPCNTARVRFRNHQQPRGQNTHWPEEQSVQVVRVTMTLLLSPSLSLALLCSPFNFYPSSLKPCYHGSVYLYRQHSVTPLNHPFFYPVVALFIPFPFICMLHHLFTFMIMHCPFLSPLLIILLSLLFLVIWLVCVCVCVCVCRLGEVDEGMKNAQLLLVKQNTQVTSSSSDAERSSPLTILQRTFLSDKNCLRGENVNGSFKAVPSTALSFPFMAPMTVFHFTTLHPTPVLQVANSYFSILHP